MRKMIKKKHRHEQKMIIDCAEVQKITRKGGERGATRGQFLSANEFWSTRKIQTSGSSNHRASAGMRRWGGCDERYWRKVFSSFRVDGRCAVCTCILTHMSIELIQFLFFVLYIDDIVQIHEFSTDMRTLRVGESVHVLTCTHSLCSLVRMYTCTHAYVIDLIGGQSEGARLR